MTFSVKLLAALFIVLCLFSSIHANDEKDDNDRNLKYLINSVDLKNKEFNPGKPQNKFEEVMGEYMKSIMAQNAKTQKKITLIGPIEFEVLSDLASTETILVLRENIEQYRRTKKTHYDTLDILMRKVNTTIGKTDLAKKRLGGSGAFYEEKLELFFLYDLDKYYEFLFNNHDKFSFQGEEIYGTDDKVLKQYNVLRKKMVLSANNINKTQELKNNLLKDRMEELKDWAKN